MMLAVRSAVAGGVFDRLLDDAALFPPARMEMEQAVAAHLAHEASWYAALLGPFVCPVTRLPEGAVVYAEVPWRERDVVARVLDVLAGTGIRAKLRTGGLKAAMFPSDAERDEPAVTGQVKRIGASVRCLFAGFGTCSVLEPVEELVRLGLLEEPL
jgi:hypothetical protein